MLLEHALTPGTAYTASFAARVPGGITAVGSANVSIELQPQLSPLELRVAGGDQRTVGRDLAFNLDAISDSVDP